MPILHYRTRSLSLFLLSLAVHLFLLFATGIHIISVDITESSEQIPEQEIVVNLLQNNQSTNLVRTSSVDVIKQKTRSLPSTRHPAAEQAQIFSDALFEILVPAEPHYFKTNELTEKPKVMFDVSPILALSLKDESTPSATLRILINESGDVDEVVIEESTFSDSGQRLLIDTLKKMKFEPGQLEGKPVKSEMRIEMMLEDISPRRGSK